MKRDKRADISSLLALPVRRGDLVVRSEAEAKVLRQYATLMGILIMTRRQRDGVHVWRLQ